MIEKILPRGAIAAELGEVPPGVTLFAEEDAALGAAVEKRRREFAIGRACARAALEGLGLPRCAVPVGRRGEPLWPEGVVGSITHCAGFGAAAVARGNDVIAIGIDAEPHEPLPDGVLDQVAFGEELAQLAELSSRSPAICWDRLLFSAKESVYKAWYPMMERWLGFEDAVVRLEPGPERGTFVAAAGQEPSPTSFEGRWLVGEGLIATAVVLAANSAVTTAATSATCSSR